MTPNPQDSAVTLEVERVYLVATGETHEGQETYTRHDVRPPLCDAEVLYTRASQSDGTSGVPDGWRIEPDEEGMRVVSPSGDGCYVWDKDSLNSPAFMGICQREVFRQLCQSLVFPAPNKSQGENHVG